MVFLTLATFPDSKQGVSRSLSRSRFAWLLVSILRLFLGLDYLGYLSGLRKQLTEGLSFSLWKLLSRLMLWKVSILFLAVLVVDLSKMDRVLFSCQYLFYISLILLINSFLELLKSASLRFWRQFQPVMNFFCCERSLAMDLLFDFYRSISLFLLRYSSFCLFLRSRHYFYHFPARISSCFFNDCNSTNSSYKFLMQTFKLLFSFLSQTASSVDALFLVVIFCSSWVRVAMSRATSSPRSSFSFSAVFSLFCRKSLNLRCLRMSSSWRSAASYNFPMYFCITYCSRDWYSCSNCPQCSQNCYILNCCRSSPYTISPCRVTTSSLNLSFSPSNFLPSLRS